LPKAWPTRCAEPQSMASSTSATSMAKSQCRAVERAATLSDTAHVNGDGLQPSGTECARQVVKITGAAAGVREQHDRGARPAKGELERRAADFDLSVLPQPHSPASRLTLGAQSIS
jgi:hypothetical protein